MKIGGQRIPGKTLVLVLSEAALIGCGLLFATALRFLSLEAVRQQLSEPGALVRYGLVIAACELAFYYYDLYDLSLVRRRTILFARLLQALGAACLILVVVYYVDPELSLGRGIAVIAAPIIITFVISWRLLVDAGLPFFRRRQRVLIMGSGSAGRALALEIVSRPELNIEIVGFLTKTRAAAIGRSDLRSRPPGITTEERHKQRMFSRSVRKTSRPAFEVRLSLSSVPRPFPVRRSVPPPWQPLWMRLRWVAKKWAP